MSALTCTIQYNNKPPDKDDFYMQASTHTHTHTAMCCIFVNFSLCVTFIGSVFHLLAALFVTYLCVPASWLKMLHYKRMVSPHQLRQGRVLVFHWKQLTTTVSTIALTRTNDISEPFSRLATRWLTWTGQRWASPHQTIHKQLNGSALLFRLLCRFF